MNPLFQDQIFQRILAGDLPASMQLVDDWAEGRGYDRAVVEIVEPVLNKIGERWGQGCDLNLAQAYIAAKVSEYVLQRSAETASHGTAAVGSKGTIVLGNIEDDYHALGRKLVGTFLRSAGWHILDLGNDVLPEAFVDKAVDSGAKVVGVSAMMHSTALNIRRVREEIDRRGLGKRLQMAVGGAVFVLQPELVETVGGDGSARNALETPALMDRLWEQALAAG